MGILLHHSTSFDCLVHTSVHHNTLDNMGKVHGGLARADKVKGQTPKVLKQEKKKGLTGRAKRRAQYIKRFIDVRLALVAARARTTTPRVSPRPRPRPPL